MKNTLHSLLKHHVTGAIDRGEAKPIVEIPANLKGAFPLHTTQHEEFYVITTSQGNHYAKTFDPSAARLISAAPDLLAICEEIANDSKCDLVNSERRIRLYSAISKAKGEAL